MTNAMKQLCLAPSGQSEVLQGNIAFAAGCVRAGIHCADGYPGTPSSEVIDRGLSQVQDLINVGWSVSEAVAAAVGHGHTLAGHDCVVTMKIPGLFQAADIFTSGAMYVHERGGLIYYIASDFVPSSTQHTIDPRYLFKSCFTPVFEPRSHQELHEAAGIAVEIARQYKTQVVVMPSGILCHSEGLVQLMPCQHREAVKMPVSLKAFNVLPSVTRKNFETLMAERMPALAEMVETSPLNRWDKGSGKVGVVTYGICDLYVREVRQRLGLDLDVLSPAFSNPLPMGLIRRFCQSIEGEIFVIEDGSRYLQEAMEQAGLRVCGKEPFSSLTEWTPALIAAFLAEGAGISRAGKSRANESRPLLAARPAVPPAARPPVAVASTAVAPVARPPVICAGCPYRLFTNEVALLKKKGQLEAIFGDIGCNTLLFFMGALDTGLAMGASEGKRVGFVSSRPEKAGRCLSIIGDSTECHSGLDATRNAVYRHIPGVKVILDNGWTAMTGGQPSPTSPANLAGQPNRFDLPAVLQAHGANVVVVGAYDRKAIRKALKAALSEADKGVYTTIVVTDGGCIQKVPPSRQRVWVDAEACKKCGICLICPGLEAGPDEVPFANHLCAGCGGHTPACVQTCPHGLLKAVDLDVMDRASAPSFATPPPLTLPPASTVDLPARLSLAIRGVGGQGNLFFGRVLTQLAFLAGYDAENIVKGETHGMAQMGGPVISTFACGDVLSPVLLPGTADCLIAMEQGEVLRPGFLDMLNEGGAVLLANTRILPLGLGEDQYPGHAQIREVLSPYRTIEVDVLGKALELGDASGRIANVVMLGVLSRISPFDRFPAELWLEALRRVNSRPDVWAANNAAFNAGRSCVEPQMS
jgi:indolepyruvate ferredoxin oxidoreductase alpha subunit